MKNLFLVLASLGFSIQSFANPCGAKVIPVGKDKVELVKVQDHEMIAGIYKFVRKGQTWNVFRCADENRKDSKGNPLFNSEKCVVKNDFAFGSLVKRHGNSGITVRKTDANQLEVRLSVAGGEDLDYYDVKATEKGLELLENQFKPNKVQPSQSRHDKVSLGVCDAATQTAKTTNAPAGKAQGTPAKKVGITN